MDLAKKVKELRNKMFIIQMELGEMLGISLSTVNRWEMGMYEPTIKMKRRLNELFKENKINLEDK